MLYVYDKEEELIINKIQKITEYGEHQYTEVVSSDDYYHDYKFDYYYVPINIENFSLDSDDLKFQKEKINSFVAKASCILDRGYYDAGGDKIINNWQVSIFK